ncbi:xylulokinase [Paenibacillus thermotolerans]|uniref:xylulokinase n=1 Tax=Paenibacillus thermotolerans TaxID=3027807 RepID=UPI002368C32D|nr:MULTISPECIES: xylulokinase [unclassified Paenibacillus]
MKYVAGIDLGTSAVKVLLVDAEGRIRGEASRSYPLYHERSGYSEQDPDDWVRETKAALAEAVKTAGAAPEQIEGISFSGQMHGLVLLDEAHRPIRRAILWNDTRTTEQCRFIEAALGDELLDITRNVALEGFTLPKLLWVKQYEPELYAQAKVFLLPKDYVRFRLTGTVFMDVSDAAGTLLLDVREKRWSETVCGKLGVDIGLCPPIAEAQQLVGTLLPDVAAEIGLSPETKVFAGGADNACGAVGAGILSSGAAMCSIGTSGVILAYEDDKNRDFAGKVHFFNHAKQDAFYAMGVTLSAGHSLSWFRETFAPGKSFGELLEGISAIPAGSGGLLYTPYIVGERTPHADSIIRGSFIGMDASHTVSHFARAVMEGITFSLNESIELFRAAGKQIDRIVSIGGGAKNPDWLQMQADIFGAEVVSMNNEQGPGMGAAMLAAAGCGWFASLQECADAFLSYGSTYAPNPANVQTYREVYEIYKEVYSQTKGLNEKLQPYRQ